MGWHDIGDITAETLHIDDGPHVTAETSRRIGLDCSAVAIVEGENGEVFPSLRPGAIAFYASSGSPSCCGKSSHISNQGAFEPTNWW